MMRRRRPGRDAWRGRILLAGVALASVLAGCGGDGGTAGSSSTQGGAEAAGDGGSGSDATGVPEEATAEGVHGQAPAAAGGLPSIVLLWPAPGGTRATSADVPVEQTTVSVPARGEDAVVDQFGLAFSPKVLVVAAGSPVRFTNSEGAITHNVHVRSIAGDSTVFNGDTGPSDGVDVALPGPGAYDVLCDMHPGMTGFLYVTEAPYATAAETGGSFTLGPIPPGEYTARVWTATDGLGPERTVTVDETDPRELDLTGPG